MPNNTTGFEFSNDPASPNSDANAENLNAAVERALIFNIGDQAVQSAHIHPNIAGAGLGGGAGEPLRVKVDGSTVEILNDAIALPDSQIIGASRIVDGSITMDKLAEEVKSTITNVLKTLYKVGDYFITHNSENPANRFGGTWELCKDVFLLGAGGEYDVLSTGGETEHTLSLEEMPKHTHTLKFGENGQTGGAGSVTYGQWRELESSAAGEGKAHNNMPPYKAVFIWVKISDEDETEEAEE